MQSTWVHSLDFIDRSHNADKPFFLWHNLTRMHVFTHLSDEWKDKTGYGLYADGMASSIGSWDGY